MYTAPYYLDDMTQNLSLVDLSDPQTLCCSPYQKIRQRHRVKLFSYGNTLMAKDLKEHKTNYYSVCRSKFEGTQTQICKSGTPLKLCLLKLTFLAWFCTKYIMTTPLHYVQYSSILEDYSY